MTISQTITSLPTAPDRSSPSTFSERADDFVGALPDLVSEVNTWAGQANSTATTVNGYATSAASSASSAATSATQAAAAANFEGEWDDLTGALNMPASVYHDTNIWILNTDLADVTTSEPATTNADWILFDSYGGVESDSSATGITLTNASKRTQILTLTAAGKFVTLPDATTMQMGVDSFVLVNNGDYRFGVKDSAGSFICSIRAKTQCRIILVSNATSAGTWKAVDGSDLFLAHTKTVLNTDDTMNYMAACKLTSTESFIAWQGADDDGFCAVVTYSDGAFTVSNILEFDTTAAAEIDVCRMTDTVAIVGYKGGASNYGITKAITYDGVDTLTVTDSYNFTAAAIRKCEIQPIYENASAGKIGVVYILTSDYDIYAQVLEWDGSTIESDTAQTSIAVVYSVYMNIDLISGAVDSANIICTYTNSSDDNSVNAIIIAWDGTTITKGSALRIDEGSFQSGVKSIDANFSIVFFRRYSANRPYFTKCCILYHSGTTVSLKYYADAAIDLNGAFVKLFLNDADTIIASVSENYTESNQIVLVEFKVITSTTPEDCDVIKLSEVGLSSVGVYNDIVNEIDSGGAIFYKDTFGDGYLACQKIEIG